MTWQEIVFFLGNFVFWASLIPMIRGATKPPLTSSGPTSLILFLFAGSFLSLRLYFSAISNFITAILWAILFFQKYNEFPYKNEHGN